MSVKRKNKAEKTEPLSGLCNVLMVRLECYVGTEAEDGIVFVFAVYVLNLVVSELEVDCWCVLVLQTDCPVCCVIKSCCIPVELGIAKE